MGVEIERKFLVVSEAWRTGAAGVAVRQGYLLAAPGTTVRVRLAGAEGYLTIKGQHHGLRRAEFEYAIPAADAQAMLETLCAQPVIEKTRYRVDFAGLVWEVDVFAGANAGLVVAEVELESEAQAVTLPPWVGLEVSSDYRYTNAYLAQHPYTTWSGHV